MNIYCQQSGYHQDEPLELLCLNPECISNNKVLNCIACIEESHSGHSVIHYKKFIQLLQKQGQQLTTDIDCRLQESATQTDLIGKLKDIMKQLNEIQELVNESINKQKDMIEKKLQYYEEFACPLPTFDIFNKAYKLHDSGLVQKLMCQFFQKVEYNSKRQDFNIRRDYLIDSSEETEGENFLFRKLKDLLDQFRNDKIENDFMRPQTQQSMTISERRKKTSGLPQELMKGSFTNGFKRMMSMDKSPGSPDDRISVTQSLSQFYYKPKDIKKKIGQQISLIESSNTFITTYQYHSEFFNEGLLVIPKQVKLTLDKDRCMALIKPSIYGSGLTREQKITLQIKVCRNSNQRYPMAIGICNQSVLKNSNYNFSGSAEHVLTSNNKDHGCYLLNSNGVIRSMIGPDLVRSSPNLRFYSNSTIEMTFKPFHKQLVINRDQQVQTTIPIELQKDQKLFFCVRLADLHDCIEIL